MTDLTFTVFGVPQPKGSTRAFVPKGWTRPIITSANPKNKGWQQLVAEAASRALDGRGQLFEGPVALSVAFYLPRPKSLPKRITDHLKKPDLDKLTRCAGDALTKVLWRDDSQVVRIVATKAYAEANASPRAVVRVWAVMQLPLDTSEPQRRTGAARILRTLAAAYPDTLTADQLGEKADLNPRSGTFSTYLSRLRTLELIESGRGWLRASEELFS
jgi:Holliday junction resolvase RusA-like endonuclease